MRERPVACPVENPAPRQFRIATCPQTGMPPFTPLPDGVKPYRIDWRNTLAIASYHALALHALMPAFSNWTALIVAIVAARLFGLLGINIGYHRLLTHRGFKCPKWLEHSLVIITICCAVDIHLKVGR